MNMKMNMKIKIKKLIICLFLVFSFFNSFQIKSYATSYSPSNADKGTVGFLYNPLLLLVTALGDGVYTVLQKIMLPENQEAGIKFSLIASTSNYDNMKYGVFMILSNQIPILDADFLTSNSKSSLTSKFHDVIALYFYQLRNLVVLLLLVVLVYIGIRMMLSATSKDKAKYKTMFANWVFAVGILFTLHLFMFLVLRLNNLLLSSLSNVQSDTLIRDIRITIEEQFLNGIIFKRTGTVIIYIALIYLTILFTIKYFKRVIYVAFLTLIAPIVVLTYPIDKIKDGKAQAFGNWFKEYIFNIIIQPIDLIIYIVLVSSAISFIKANVLYGVMAITFIIPCEKFVQALFNIKPKHGAKPQVSIPGVILASSAAKKIGKTLNKFSSSTRTSRLANRPNPNNSRLRRRISASRLGRALTNKRFVSTVKLGAKGLYYTGALGAGAIVGTAKTVATGDLGNLGKNIVTGAAAGYATGKVGASFASATYEGLAYILQPLSLSSGSGGGPSSSSGPSSNSNNNNNQTNTSNQTQTNTNNQTQTTSSNQTQTNTNSQTQTTSSNQTQINTNNQSQLNSNNNSNNNEDKDDFETYDIDEQLDTYTQNAIDNSLDEELSKLNTKDILDQFSKEQSQEIQDKIDEKVNEQTENETEIEKDDHKEENEENEENEKNEDNEKK